MKKIKLILSIALIALTGTLFSQTVIVSDDPAYTTGQASSVLDVKSTTKGFLVPRMLQSERVTILSPATGLLVFQTDATSGFYYFDGSIWVMLPSGTFASYLPLAGGTMTGELNTVASTNATVGLNLPHGNAPDSPVNGDIWTTILGVYVQIDGSTIGPLTNGDNAFMQGGNSFGALAKLGTGDDNDLAIITNNTENMRIAATGNVGIGTSTFNSLTPEKLKVDAGATGTDNFQSVLVGFGNTNSFAQINIQNTNSGDNASSDLVATADNGTDSSYYVDMGINSSTFNLGTFDVSGPNDGYLYVVGNADGTSSGGNMILGTANQGKALKFFTGGSLGTNERMRINGVGQVKISDLGNIITNDASSLLELESNTKGILIPRVVINNLALPAPLTAPSEGMLVYGLGGSVPNGFYYWNGSSWILMGGSIAIPLPVSSGGTGLKTLGNTNTLLYTSSTDNIANVPTSSADGQFLHTTTAGSIPTWQTMLGIANGGTGSTTQNFVDLTTGQTVAGIKTFSAVNVFQAGFTSTGGTINLNDDSNFPTNINTGTSKGLVNIGNTGGATSTTISSGTGGINLNTASATNETTTLGTTGSSVFASSTANSDKIAILPQSTVNTNSFTGSITSADLTATRTWTFPDATGTIITSGSFPGWLLGGNAPGAPSIFGTTDNSAVSVQTGTGALNLGTDAAAKAITLGNATGTTSTTITSGTGGIILNTGAATNMATTLGTTGSAVFESSTTNSDKIAILPQSSTNTNTFTGTITSSDLTGARTWTFPDVSGTLLTTGSLTGWALGGNAPGVPSIFGTTDNSTVTVQTGTGALNLGTDAAAKTITLGNATGTTSATITSGTGGIILNTGTATNVATTLGTTGAAVFGSSTTNSDKIAILPQSSTNTNTFTGTITSLDLTGARTWTLPDVSGTLLTTGTLTGWALGGNATAGASVIGTTDNSAVTFQTGTGALNLGTDAAAKAITLGNATGATSATITSGTGGINLNTGAATNETTTLGTTGSAVFASSTANSDKIAILPQSSTNTNTFTGSITSADLTAARTWTFPDASGTLLTSGTFAGWLLGGNAPGVASVIGTTDNSAVTFQTGTGALNLGTDAAAKTITIGNVTGATSINENVGTGNYTLNGVGASNYSIGAASTSGIITIGGTGAQTGTIGIGTGTGAQIINLGTGGTGIKTMNIGTGAVANVITIGSTTGAASLTENVGSGNYSLDGVGASNYSIGASTTSGAITIGGAGAQIGAIGIGTGSGAQTLNYGTGAGIKTMNIGTGAVANIITIGSITGAASTALKAGTGGLAFSTGAATNVTSTMGTTGSSVFASSTANSDKIAILPQSTTNTNTFTGSITSADLTATRTWTLPDASGTILTSATFAGWLIGGNAPGGASILGTTDNSAVSFQTGTGALDLGADAAAKAITIGNVTGATSLTANVGTGNFTLNGVGASSYTIGAATTTGTFTFGGTTQTGNIIFGSSNTTNNLFIANGVGSTTLNLANVQNAGAINMGAGMTTGTITIGGTGLQTGTIGIGVGSGAQTLNFGTGAGAKAITIGSITGASSLTLKAGTGNINIPDAVMLDMSAVNNSTATEGLKLPQSNDNTAATAEGQIAWDADNDVLTVGTGTVAKNIGIPNGMVAFTTSNAAWAHPVGVKYVWVKVWGAGGGGGNAANNASRGGGGGGAYSESIVDVSNAATHAIVVGTGGAAGANGGASSFTGVTVVSANGGTGTTINTGGAGGTVSGAGSIKIPGGNGAISISKDGSSGGTGGGSPFGGAGGGGGAGSNTSNNNVNGTAGTFPGGGGGGGSEISGTGAAGAGGYVIVYW